MQNSGPYSRVSVYPRGDRRAGGDRRTARLTVRRKEEKMGGKVFVIGVGMTKFEKPFSKEWDYPDMAKEAGGKALADAGIAYDEVQQACIGYCYGESTGGQRAGYGLGLTGVPLF